MFCIQVSIVSNKDENKMFSQAEWNIAKPPLWRLCQEDLEFKAKK
jgi:hypothetical protein